MRLIILAVALSSFTLFAQPAPDGGPDKGSVVTTTTVTQPSAQPHLDQTPAIVTTTVEAPGNDWQKVLSDIAMSIGSILLLIITGTLLPAFRKWATAKAEGQEATTGTKVLFGGLVKLEQFIEAGLIKVWGVFQADMNKARLPDSPGGSSITDTEMAAAREHVLAEVKQYLGEAGLAELTSALGFGGALLDTFLRSQIDKKIQAATAAGSVAAASVANGTTAANVLASL